MGHAAYFDPRARGGGVVFADRKPARRYDARGVSGDGFADGDHGIPAVSIYVRQRVEGEEAAERDFGLAGHTDGDLLLGSANGGSEKRVGVRRQARGGNSGGDR